MADDKTIQMLAISGTGDGTTHIETPTGKANIAITYITPLLAIIIRSAKAFIITMSGILTGSVADKTLMPANDFWDLLIKAASFSVAAAVLAALASSVSLLSKLEEKFPTLGA